MVNIKSKLGKRASDNEKRRKSIVQKEKAKLNQSLIIKQALSNPNLHENLQKITFSDEECDISEKTNDNNKKLNENGKSVLFDDSASEDEHFQIIEKTQFSGKKGFELLNLQSTYGNDERFKVDERFLENEKEDQNENKTLSNDNASEEKVKQLKILESVLGTPIFEPEKKNKIKKRTYEMVRYDASNKGHEIYEINNLSLAENGKKTSPKKIEGKNKKLKIIKELNKPLISREKFYKVSNEIKNSFKEKKKDGQFSLLQSYSMNVLENAEAEIRIKNDKGKEEGGDNIEDAFIDENNFARDSEYNNDQIKEEPKKEKNGLVAQGIWKESFFFTQNDDRIKEGLEFINKKGSTEAIEAAENYYGMRKTLKEILRLHLKKQMSKKDPFKNKIGGMNKKQLTNSKLRNPKMVFNKKRLVKKNLDVKA